MWYCGWDGGGTKTEVCVLNASGEKIACQIFGPLNLNGASQGRVISTVADAVSFLNSMPGGQEACGSMVIGAAGISNLEVSELLSRALLQSGWNKPFRLAGDQEIALAGAIDGHGAILIAGTGAICYGRDPLGHFFRVGGYGYLIDDGGSGYAIGRDILSAVVRAEDQRGQPTLLTRLVRKTLECKETGVHEMITWLYAPDTGKKEIAALARLLPDALCQDDPVAQQIAQKAATDLAELALTAWQKSGMTDGELAATGSILTSIPAIRQRTEEEISRHFPLVRVISPRHSPSVGAAMMAMEDLALHS